jgi:transcriptional regulator with XRE-family HTH domain
MPKQSAFKKKHRRRRHYFKEWREHRGLTQEKVAERIGTTKTRVSMKEGGKEPYDQPYLEALSDALNIDPASLIMRNPGDGDAIWSIWERAKPGERETIERLAGAIITSRAGS